MFENIQKYSKSWVKYSKIFDFFVTPLRELFEMNNSQFCTRGEEIKN